MTVRKIGKKTLITFTYLEWVANAKSIPIPGEEITGVALYTIIEVPEDKKEYFESLGLTVRLSVRKGNKKW